MVSYCLTLDNMNKNIKEIKEVIYGPLLMRVQEIRKELEEGKKKPFNEVLNVVLGDGHAMGQKPITFVRQVLAMVTLPSILGDPSLPDDAKTRARNIIQECRGQSIGSYSDSVGLELVRQHIAQYIEKRDGVPSDYRDFIVTNGASDGIKNVLKILNQPLNEKRPGVLVPVPQYFVYGAILAEFNMCQIDYYLDEDSNWGLDLAKMQTAVDESRAHCVPRAMVIINPGNPTGQILTRENIENVIKFAYKENLFLLADEVYQDNTYSKKIEFHSFKKVMSEMGPPFSKMELASFMSCSKGYMGECGIRGGSTEVVNLCPQVKAMLFKAVSSTLCSTTLGQTAMECLVNSPRLGEPSYELFVAETEAVLKELAEKAQVVTDVLNSIPGIKCTEVQGAMYAFPSIKIPPKAIAEAESQGQVADVFYAFQLLEETGICVVPGSVFGQLKNTYHFRITILLPVEKLILMLKKLRRFHVAFTERYSGEKEKIYIHEMNDIVGVRNIVCTN